MRDRSDQNRRKEVGLNVRIPVALRRRIKVYCAQNEQTVEAFVIETLESKLTEEEAQEAREIER